MLLVQAKLQVGVNMTMTFHLHVEDEQVIRKVLFRDLVEMPKRERYKTPRWKIFTSHLLMSLENQQKIKQADEVARKKEQHIIEKQKLIKNLITEDKKKKKLHAVQIKLRQENCFHIQGGVEGEVEGGVGHQNCRLDSL